MPGDRQGSGYEQIPARAKAQGESYTMYIFSKDPPIIYEM